jgi:hypothetical protein
MKRTKKPDEKIFDLFGNSLYGSGEVNSKSMPDILTFLVSIAAC